MDDGCASQARQQAIGDDREIVAGLVHGLVRAAGASRKSRALTQSELSAMTGLTRATARRSLITLTSLGYVEAEDNTYRLTPKVIELATGYFNSNDGWIAHRRALSGSAAQQGRGECLGRRARPHRHRLRRLFRGRYGDVDQCAHRRAQAGLLHRDGARAARRNARGLRPRRACDEQHPAQDRADRNLDRRA